LGALNLYVPLGSSRIEQRLAAHPCNRTRCSQDRQRSPHLYAEETDSWPRFSALLSGPRFMRVRHLVRNGAASFSSGCIGGPRAGLKTGRTEGRPMCSRILTMTSSRRMTAMISRSPRRGLCGTWFAMVHLGHICGSMPYIFHISRAQRNGTCTRRVRLGAASATTGRCASGYLQPRRNS